MQLVLSVGEHNKCIPEDNDFAELRNLLAKKKDPVCYDGFEPSGRMHIAQVTSVKAAVDVEGSACIHCLKLIKSEKLEAGPHCNAWCCR